MIEFGNARREAGSFLDSEEIRQSLSRPDRQDAAQEKA